MAEEFEDRDLSASVFWGVNLRKATFRDADFSGSTFFHTEWRDVSIDGVIDRLVVNGVDVTSYVNEHDIWHPLRVQLSPDSVEEMRATWENLCAEWAKVLDRVSGMPPDAATVSVNGEWSLRDTLRHLMFAMDKWFMWPILGRRDFTPMGLPNTGSIDRDWPGLDRTSDPTFAAVLETRASMTATFTDYLSSLDLTTMEPEVDVLENGSVPALMCFHVVFEEEFEHLRYALRDLSVLTAG